MSNRDKIIDKIKKLRAHQESVERLNEEEEARAFAVRIHELMLRHKIAEHELNTADTDDKNKDIVHRYMRASDGVEHKRQRTAWSEHLGAVVAKAHQCCTVSIYRSNYLIFVGTEQDTEAAIQTFSYLWNVMDKMSWKAYNKLFYGEKAKGQNGDISLARGYRQAWLTGFITLLAQRYEAAMRNLLDEATNPMALARIGKDLQRAEEDRAKWTKQAPRRKRKDLNTLGFMHGRKAAEKTPLSGEARQITVG